MAWLDYLRHCKLCGISLGKTPYVCSECWKNIYQNKLEAGYICIQPQNIDSYYLWYWKQKEDPVAGLVYDFKNSGMQSLAQQLVSEMIRRFYHHLIPVGHIIYPTKNISNKRDHAYLLAKELGKFFNCTPAPLLVTSDKHYRMLKRQERAVDRSISAIDEFSVPRGKNILFVDDVLTTGTTLRQSHIALKGSKYTVKALIMAYKAKDFPA